MTDMTLDDQFATLDALRLIHHALNRDGEAAEVLLDAKIPNDIPLQRFVFAIAQIAVTYGEAHSSKLEMSSYLRRGIAQIGKPT